MAAVEKTESGVKTTVSRGGTKAISRVEIEPSKNGGFIVREFYRSTDKRAGKGGMSFTPNSYMDPETATYKDFPALVEGLETCFDADDADDTSDTKDE